MVDGVANSEVLLEVGWWGGGARGSLRSLN